MSLSRVSQGTFFAFVANKTRAIAPDSISTVLKNGIGGGGEMQAMLGNNVHMKVTAFGVFVVYLDNTAINGQKMMYIPKVKNERLR